MPPRGPSSRCSSPASADGPSWRMRSPGAPGSWGFSAARPRPSRAGRGFCPSLPAAPLGEARSQRLPDADWANSYREHFKAWTFGRLHWVPVWERGSFRLPGGTFRALARPWDGVRHRQPRDDAPLHREAGRVRGGRARRGGPRERPCPSSTRAAAPEYSPFRPPCSAFATSRDSTTIPEAVRVSLENAQLNGLVGQCPVLGRGPAGGAWRGPGGRRPREHPGGRPHQARPRALGGRRTGRHAGDERNPRGRDRGRPRRVCRGRAGMGLRLEGPWRMVRRLPAPAPRALPQEKSSGVVRVRNSSM